MGCSAVGCMKKLLILFNFIFILIGLILIGFGVYQLTSDGFSGSSSINATLISGIVVFVISLFGFCGACRESYCLLVSYSIILIILFVIELGYGIILTTGGTNEHIKPVAINTMDRMFDEFKRNNTEELDNFQKVFKCCGVNGTSDFEPVLGKGILPISCCEYTESSEIPTRCTTEDKYHENGCAEYMIFVIKSVMWTDAVISIGVAVLFIFTAIIAIILGITIKNRMRRRYP